MSIILLTYARNHAILKILKKETRLMNYLTYLPVFDKLTKSQQDTLTSSSFVRKFSKGDLLHNGSQNCTGLILILSGQIRAFTTSDDGREVTMYRLFERDICLFSAFILTLKRLQKLSGVCKVRSFSSSMVPPM